MIGTPQAERADGKVSLPWQLRQRRGQAPRFFLAEMVRHVDSERQHLRQGPGGLIVCELGSDFAMRLGESVDKDMIAVRIGPDWRLRAVASPEYFTKHAIPNTPPDLVGHVYINMRQETWGGFYSWEFEKDGRELRVRVDGQLSFNSSIAQIDAALNGYGIAYLPEDLVEEHLAVGRLQAVLDDWSQPFSGHHLYYPSRRQMSPAMTVIVDALRHRSYQIDRDPFAQ